MVAAFLLAAFISEVVGTLVGFGSSTVFLPLALLFLEFKSALVLVAFLHIFGNLARLRLFRKGLQSSLVVWFGLPSVLFSLAGALLVGSVPQVFLKGCLGVFLVLYAGLSLRSDTVHVGGTRTGAVFGGALSGFFAGLIGTGGALRGAYLSAFHLPKATYIATAAVTALAVDLTRIPVYLTHGFLEVAYVPLIPALLLMAIAGSFVGERLVSIIPQRAFRTTVFIAIFCIGVKFIYDWAATMVY